MADTKISQLPAASTLTGSELVPVVQSSVTKQTTLADMPVVPYGTGAVTRTIQSKFREFVSVTDFMSAAQKADVAAGTLSVDCLSAFQAALDSFAATPGSNPNTYGGTLYIPPGSYYLSNTWNVDRQVRIFGAAAPDGNAIGSVRLYFADGVDGIVFHNYVTSVSGDFSDGSVLQGVYITRKVKATSSGDGIWLRARARLRDVVIDSMGRYGVRIEATAGGSPNGNANNWSIENCRIMSCGSHGLFVDGADVNAGVAVRLDSSSNTGWGIFDSSFLGNTYVGCHTAANTAGSYKTDNANARNMFVGCYAEGGQPAANLVPPTSVIGGAWGTTITGSPYMLMDGILGPTSVYQNNNFGSATERKMEFADNGPALMALRDPNETSGAYPFRWKGATGAFYWDWANGGNRLFEFTNSQATVANGYPREVYARNPNGGVAFRQGYMNGPNMKYRGTGTAAPTTGTYVQGDIVWNEAPTNAAGQAIGWVCVVGGTPGTWRAFGVTV